MNGLTLNKTPRSKPWISSVVSKIERLEVTPKSTWTRPKLCTRPCRTSGARVADDDRQWRRGVPASAKETRDAKYPHEQSQHRVNVYPESLAPLWPRVIDQHNCVPTECDCHRSV